MVMIDKTSEPVRLRKEPQWRLEQYFPSPGLGHGNGISSAFTRYGVDYRLNFSIDYEKRLRYKPFILAREARENAPRGEGAV
jgi:hypothetical protein